jgi:hydroxymethylpyrimidine pyrophosphatase-like HAD family hydrolase
MVSQVAIRALERLRASGRRLILVTGRQLPDLLRIFGRVDLFERIVAENGAVLHRPAGRDTRVLADRPPDQFIRALRKKRVKPLAVGKVVVATLTSNATPVLEVIQDLGLELQPIFNKDSLMVLPPGVDKATGLAAALADMAMSPANVVGIGDAENDLALLRLCGFGVAVANAVPLLKERADLVTQAADGAGVAELATRLLATDLAGLVPST